MQDKNSNSLLMNEFSWPLYRISFSLIFRFKFVQAGQANIHEALEYRSRQAAKIVSWTNNEVWYGSACMKEAFAEGIDYANEYVKVNNGERVIDLCPLEYLSYTSSLIIVSSRESR